MEVKERLYLTEDDRVVPDGDPDVRWLYAILGSNISDADAAKYGIVDGLAPRPESEPEATPEPEPKPKRKRKK